MLNQITLYFNTGFDEVNLPSQPSILTRYHTSLPIQDGEFGYTNIDFYVDKQDYFLDTIKLKITWDNIKGADYLKYGNAYYFIKSVKMLNKNTAELFLKLDALTTMGGAVNLNYDHGTIIRCHQIDDSLFANITPEVIGCSEELEVIDLGDMITDEQQEYLVVVVSTADLTTIPIGSNAITFSNNEASVTIPQAPAASSGTTIGTYTLTGNQIESLKSYKTEGYGYYLFENTTTQAVIQYVRSLGLESSILNCYAIPKNYITYATTSEEGNKITNLYGNCIGVTKQGSEINYQYPSVKNMKTYLMYNYLMVRGNTSGNMKQYNYKDVKTPTTSLDSPTYFKVYNDPQYNGCPYCGPEYFKDDSVITNPTYESIVGLPWYSVPLTFDSASGSAWSEGTRILNNLGGLFNYEQGIKETRFNQDVTIQNAGLGAGSQGINNNIETYSGGNYIGSTIGNPMAILNGLMSTINSESNRQLQNTKLTNNYELNNSKNWYNYAQDTVTAPVLSSTPAVGMQRFLNNTFELYHVKPTTNDIKNIDNFFTLFGYSQPNIKFEKKYLNIKESRKFNYIQCGEIKIALKDGAQVGQAIKTMAETQLKQGVRLWNDWPSLANYPYN